MGNKGFKTGEGVTYPWEKWFYVREDRREKTITLVPGRHFNCKPHGMAQQVRNRASLLGQSVSINICTGGKIIVTIWR